MKTKSIYLQSYKSKDLFKTDFFKALNKLIGSNGRTPEINIYIPQKSALSLVNSYLSFDELKQEFDSIKIFNNVDNIALENNIVILNLHDLIDDLKYEDVEALKSFWGNKLNKILILGQKEDQTEANIKFHQLKENTIKFIYKIPENIKVDIEMIDIPLFRIGEDIFSISITSSNEEIRPIKTDKSRILRNLKRWMDINGIENINKIISCESSNAVENYDLAAHDLSNMIEEEFHLLNKKDLLFDSNRDCNVLIFDRSCDRITPLLTDLTYAGLLKTLDGSFISDIITKQNNNGDDLEDNIFEHLKFLNFGEIGSVLQRLLKNYGKATDTNLKTRSDNNISEELNKMIKLLSNEEVISNSKNLPKHVNEASKMMYETKNPNYNLEDIIDIESLFLSEWNTQSRYLNNTSKIKFSWSKLANSGGNDAKIVDDNLMIDWIEEQNLLENYTFEKLIKVLILYIKLYGPFVKQDEFYNKLLTSFSDRFGSNKVALVFEKLFNDSTIVIDAKFNNNLFSLNSKPAVQTPDLQVLEYNKKQLQLLDYLNYVATTEKDNLLSMNLLDTLNKTTSAVGFDFFQSLGIQKAEEGTTNIDPLSFAYCGIVPVITRLIQYSLTVNSYNPSILKLAIPTEIIKNDENKEIKSLLTVNEKELLKHKPGTYTKASKASFAKTIVIFTGGATIGELATIDKLNKLMVSSFDPKNEDQMVPISVIADKIL